MKNLLKHNGTQLSQHRLVRALFGTLAAASIATVALSAPALATEDDSITQNPDGASTDLGASDGDEWDRGIGEGISNIPDGWEEGVDGIDNGECIDCAVGEGLTDQPDGWGEDVDPVASPEGDVDADTNQVVAKKASFTPQMSVEGTAVTRADVSAQLPETGAAVAGAVAGGLILIGAGAAAFFASRKRA